MPLARREAGIGKNESENKEREKTWIKFPLFPFLCQIEILISKLRLFHRRAVWQKTKIQMKCQCEAVVDFIRLREFDKEKTVHLLFLLIAVTLTKNNH